MHAFNTNVLIYYSDASAVWGTAVLGVYVEFIYPINKYLLSTYPLVTYGERNKIGKVSLSRSLY